MTGAPFPDLTNPNDAERIAARTGLTVAEVRRALARLRDPRYRDTVRRRTRSQG